MNSTISTLGDHYHHHHHHIIEPIDEPTAVNEIISSHYDSSGAALFIIVVLLWYSVSFVCMLGIQIRARAETIEDCARRRAKLFIQTFRDQTQTKQILEELVDEQKRDKLWKIYLDKTDDTKDKLKRAEIRRIKNIKKQLAVINRNRMIMNDTIITPVINHYIRRTSIDSQSTLIPDLALIESHARNRRRSSLDQQIIEQWKSIVDQSKAHEQVPWALRKVLIRRHFRRYYKNSLKEFQDIDTTTNDLSVNHENLQSIDDEQCHLLPTNQHINRNPCTIKKKTNGQLNPYITYFHLPINENLLTNNQNLPLVTMKSDHHIIQMNDDDDDEYQC